MIARHTWTVLALAACGDDPPAVLPDAPLGPDSEGRIARYLLDDDFTDGVRAEVGLDGSCRRCPRLVAGRQGGGAAEFDGAGDIIVVPAMTMGGSAQVTAAAWVRPAAAPPEFACLFSKQLDGIYRNTWQVCETAGLGLLVCADVPGGTSSCILTPDALLAVDQWHHITLTSDGTTLRAYIGSAEVGQRTTPLTVADGEILIGADVDYSAPGAFFTGAIDDLRVWNRALTPAEIAAEVAR